MNFIFRYVLFYLVLITIGCATYVKIPIVKSTPPGFDETVGTGRNMGIYINKKDSFFSENQNWKELIQGDILNKFQEKRYFRIVDVSNREARLKEITLSQMIGGSKSLSSELEIDLLLFIDIPQEPQSECKKYSNFITKKQCQRYDANGKCLSFIEKTFPEYTKELIYTVFVKARLINLENGRNIEHTNSEPAILKKTSSSPNIDCPSGLEALNDALNIASSEITDKLSPIVIDIDIPIYKDDSGIQKSPNKKPVLNLLKSGVTWLDSEKPNIEYAKRDWEKAASLSENNSLSALWNLGVYFWYKADFTKAEEWFKILREKASSEDWLDSKKRNALSIFETERQRGDKKSSKR